MTCRIDYSVQNDAQYLVMFHEDHQGNRWFFGGKEQVCVKRGEQPPDSVIHSITTIQMLDLLDAILATGLRPSSNAWSAGHVSDLKKHIAFAENVALQLLPSKP